MTTTPQPMPWPFAPLTPQQVQEREQMLRLMQRGRLTQYPGVNK